MISKSRAWEKYDIRLVLERNWKTLGPKLAGKIHVYMGDEDTFYLDGPARLLKQSLADLKSDAVVEMFPKRNHGNLVDAALAQADERGDGGRGPREREAQAVGISFVARRFPSAFTPKSNSPSAGAFVPISILPLARCGYNRAASI